MASSATASPTPAALLAPLLLALPLAAAPQQRPHHATPPKPEVLAPGYSALEFPAPEPGSYSLPPLGRAADGKLLDSAGEQVRLHDLFDGKTVVLSFIYTSCPDVNGCPLATFVLAQVQERLADDDATSANVRLVSVSFDPDNDTPDRMAEYGRAFQRGSVDWRFLTADSEASLQPILDDYDQFVIRDRGPDGKALTTMSHILRVYLIDAGKKVRNIYSPSFLHPDLLYADIRTISRTD
jgi:cytochrome oxidase Cu insertion factor (SCO1/SenC/PrrC family)